MQDLSLHIVVYSIEKRCMIRYRFYQPWGVPPLKIAKLIVFTHIAFWFAIIHEKTVTLGCGRNFPPGESGSCYK